MIGTLAEALAQIWSYLPDSEGQLGPVNRRVALSRVRPTRVRRAFPPSRVATELRCRQQARRDDVARIRRVVARRTHRSYHVITSLRCNAACARPCCAAARALGLASARRCGRHERSFHTTSAPHFAATHALPEASGYVLSRRNRLATHSLTHVCRANEAHSATCRRLYAANFAAAASACPCRYRRGSLNLHAATFPQRRAPLAAWYAPAAHVHIYA